MEHIQTAQVEKKEGVNLFTRIRLFFKEVIAELSRCVWPTRNELIETTIAVVIMVIITSLFVFGLDQVFRFISHYILHIS